MNKHISKVLGIEKLVDTHAHINSKTFDHDRADVLQRLNESGVSAVFDIGTDFESSMMSCDISQNNENVYSFVGIDPEVFIPGSNLFWEQWDIKQLDEEFEKLDILIQNNRERIRGIGETGMDFYWLEQNVEVSKIDKKTANISRKNQRMLFEKHIELASKHSLPLSIHSRGAEEECLKIVVNSNAKAIFHSYTGNYDTAKKILSAGCGLGINGIVTFKNAYELQGLYKKILGNVKFSEWEPFDFYKKGLFFESDAPYLAPEGKRGQRNEPAFVAEVFQGFLQAMQSFSQTKAG